jgi:hypothetical protein
MSLTGGGSPHRGKERELAPHLQGRNGATANGASGRGERREPREPGKRRAGEPDDWRKGLTDISRMYTVAHALLHR